MRYVVVIGNIGLIGYLARGLEWNNRQTLPALRGIPLMSDSSPSFRLAALGALSFGSIALAACVIPGEAIPLASCLALPVAGAVGGGCLAWQIAGWKAALAAAVRFAFGFGLALPIIWFSLISLQAEVEPGWGATAWGIGLAFGGAIGGSSLQRTPRSGPGRFVSPAGAAASAFGLAGVIGGWLGFTLFGQRIFQKSARGLDVGMVLALVLGGLVLGAVLGRTTEPMPPDAGGVAPPQSRE
jgi:hypothetical protein